MDGQMRAPSAMRRNHNTMRRGSIADSQLKSEIHTLQRKYDRLEKKEKRIQVSNYSTGCTKNFQQSCLGHCLLKIANLSDRKSDKHVFPILNLF